MVLIAFSLQAEVEKYGAYVGIAAFFGLAILSLLYFAQAREVKRLREWAGRAPERAAELEQAVLDHAEEVRRAPATPVPAPQPVAQPLSPSVAVAATNGVVKLKPEEVAALAFARAAGVHEPHEPKAHPVPVATVEAPPTEVAAAGAADRRGRARRRPGAQRRQRPLAHRARAGDARRAPRGRPAAAPASAASRRRRRPPSQRPAARSARARACSRSSSRRSSASSSSAARSSSSPAAVAATTRPRSTRRRSRRPRRPSAEATKTPTQAAAPTKETALIAIYNGTSQEGLAAHDPRSARDRRLSRGQPRRGHRPAGASSARPRS